MTDGAHFNVGAEAAMKAVIGGEVPPTPPTDYEFEQQIRNAPIRTPDGRKAEFTYDSAANAIARIVLEAYEQYPQLQEMSDDHVFLRTKDDKIDWSNPIALNVTLYDVIKKLHPEGTIEREVMADATGFMWGWAMNAARKILGLGPVPNPAIMTIKVP